MKVHNKILEQLDGIELLIPTEAWNQSLLERMHRQPKGVSKKFVPKISVIALALVLSLNVTSLIKQVVSQKKQAASREYREVANDILISSSSSKY